MNMDTLEDIMSLCRLCLGHDQVQIPIFGDEGDEKQIFKKINSCLKVQVSEDDLLPKNICDNCWSKLDLLHEFQNTSVESEAVLRSCITKHDIKDKQKSKIKDIERPIEIQIKSEPIDECYPEPSSISVQESFIEVVPKEEFDESAAKRPRFSDIIKMQDSPNSQENSISKIKVPVPKYQRIASKYFVLLEKEVIDRRSKEESLKEVHTDKQLKNATHNPNATMNIKNKRMKLSTSVSEHKKIDVNRRESTMTRKDMDTLKNEDAHNPNASMNIKNKRMKLSTSLPEHKKIDVNMRESTMTKKGWTADEISSIVKEFGYFLKKRIYSYGPGQQEKSLMEINLENNEEKCKLNATINTESKSIMSNRSLWTADEIAVIEKELGSFLEKIIYKFGWEKSLTEINTDKRLEKTEETWNPNTTISLRSSSSVCEHVNIHVDMIKSPVTKKSWTADEIASIEKEFASFIEKRIYPSGMEIKDFILKTNMQRSVSMIKSKLQHLIKLSKKKRRR